jgi:ATP-binding cassette subfamily B protein
MKQKTSSLLWLMRQQISASPSFMVWKLLGSIYEGISSVLSVYISAKSIATLSALIFSGGAYRSVIWWFVAAAVYQVVSLFYNRVDRLFSNRFRQQIDRKLSESMFLRLYTLSQVQFDDEQFASKLGRATDALYSVQYMFYDLFGVVSVVVRFVASMIAIVAVSPLLGLIAVVAGVPSVFLGFRQNKLENEVEKIDAQTRRVYSRTRWLLLDPNTMIEIRLVNAFKDMVKKWADSFKQSQDRIFITQKKMFVFDAASGVVGPLVELGGNIYLLQLVIAKTLQFDKFLFVRGVLTNATSAASGVAEYATRLHKLLIDFDNFRDVYDAIPTIPDGAVKVSTPLTIEFRDVCFSYATSTELAIKNVSFVLHPGSKLAIVGENGAGKSTLIKLLMRQYLPSSGEILVNGTPIQDIEQRSYYQAISTLSQKFLSVSHFTIRENITLGLIKKVANDSIEEACRLAGAWDFVVKLPHGLDTRLDSSFEDGTSLSGGQMQRLGVARALLRSADILLLDEPTSAIDAKAEYQIFNNIYKTHGDKTTVIISHRFSTVRKADSIMVMDNGRVTEYGTHDELIVYGKLYKEMFDTQAEGYK